ncbi:DNA replication complex GINS protein sld5 [Leucoagaricus sp. SymC.cos]|nr:DNA replication complex GINS protein sld5 [Leucoagaricus sp. SymC.cos]
MVPPAAPEPAAARTSRTMIDAEPEKEETPLELLTRHWINERHAPDILPAQEALLSSILDHLRRQSDAVQLLRGDPSIEDDEHLRITLVQLDIERVKFIVRSYVRTRLFKIEKYARYITSNADIQTRLTASERDHASRHADLNDRHFNFSVLQSLPEPQRHLDDETPYYMPPMMTTPDLTKPVFVHALKDCPPVVLLDGARHEMLKGHISLTHFSVVQHLIARGEAELV